MVEKRGEDVGGQNKLEAILRLLGE